MQKGFAGVQETFDNTRPLVAGMAVGGGARRRWTGPANC